VREGTDVIRPWLLCLLSLIGLGICLASSIGHQIQHVALTSPFGLLGSLPATYWVGIFVMAVSLLIGFRNRSETLFLVQAVLLFVAIWASPAMFEKNPTVWDSYMHYYSAVDIVRNGLISTDPAFEYSFNYPGFFALTAAYSALSSPPALEFLKLWPVFAAVFTLTAMYLFVRTYVPTADYRLTFLICAFVNVWMQFNFSPQSIGLAVGLLIFVCLEREGTEWKLAAVLMFAFLVISHPTTMVFILGAVVLREIYVRLKRFAASRRGRAVRESKWPVGAFLLVWIAWTFSGAIDFSTSLTKFIADRLQFLGFMGETVQNQVSMRTGAENLLGTLYPQIRTGVVVAFVGLAVIAILVHLADRKRDGPGLPINVLPLLIIPFAIIPLDTLFFNGQLYDRGLLYIMLVSPLIFVPVLMRPGRKVLRPVLTAAMACLVVMCASTVLYQESLYISTDEAISATDFLASTAPHTYLVGGYYPYKVWGDHGEDYLRLKFSTTWPESAANTSAAIGPGTFLFDETSELWYRQWGIYNMYEFYEDDAYANNRVYDNGMYWVMYVPAPLRG